MTGEPVLRVEGLSKSYGSVVALEEVDFSVASGEVLGLVGDNGAGKTTLVKCVAGSLRPSSGRIYLDGVERQFNTPREAREAGIETVYQQLALVDIFDITENLFLGRELVYDDWRGALGFLDRKRMRSRAHEAVSRLAARFPDMDAKIRTMSGGQRQVVAMTRGAFWGGRLLLLDEPTAALGVKESESVLGMIGSLVGEHSMGMIVISHNMEHVWSVCDRILVLRRGRLVANLLKEATDKSEVVGHIVGAK